MSYMNNISYCRVARKMGLIKKSLEGNYFEMIDYRTKEGKVMLYLTEEVELETVRYLIVGQYIVFDLMTFIDIANNSAYIFELAPKEVNIYKANNIFELSEEHFYEYLTDPKHYDIILTVDANKFEDMSSDEFVKFVTELNGGQGFLELGNNLRKTI